MYWKIQELARKHNEQVRKNQAGKEASTLFASFINILKLYMPKAQKKN
jgi:hypothetical protein